MDIAAITNIEDIGIIIQIVSYKIALIFSILSANISFIFIYFTLHYY